MKRLNVPKEPYPRADANCAQFESPQGSVVCIVTVNEKLDAKRKGDPNALVGLVVHEATHVWQRIRETIGERNPSHEFEAYAVQTISQELLQAYSKTRFATPVRRSAKTKRRGRR